MTSIQDFIMAYTCSFTLSTSLSWEHLSSLANSWFPHTCLAFPSLDDASSGCKSTSGRHARRYDTPLDPSDRPLGQGGSWEPSTLSSLYANSARTSAAIHMDFRPTQSPTVPSVLRDTQAASARRCRPSQASTCGWLLCLAGTALVPLRW